MTKYDVFISCKSEDYKYAEEIYNFLNSNGIYTFLASKELRILGESEYRRAISKVLKDAYHLIVFASNPEYIESAWVEYEWDMFVNAKLKKKNKGNIVTILKDVDTDDIPIDLWKYESFKFDEYHDQILQYVETPESQGRKLQQRRQDEERQKKKKEEDAKAAKLKELKSKLELTAEEYKKSVSSLQVDIDKIYGILKSLKITVRECPICHTSIPIEEKFCSKCGWPMSPLDGLKVLEYLNNGTENLQETYSKIYHDFLKLRDSVLTTEKELAKTRSELTQKQQTIEYLNHQIQILENGKKVGITNDLGQFEVWVTFCPFEAEETISKYNKDFTPRKIRENKKPKLPIYVTSFTTVNEASILKSTLEYKGATVEIRNGENAIVLENKRGCDINTTPNRNSNQCNIRTNDGYGIIISHCGIDKAKVARLLSRHFKRSTDFFKDVLLTMPYESPSSLTSEDAHELSLKLQQIGATVSVSK